MCARGKLSSHSTSNSHSSDSISRSYTAKEHKLDKNAYDRKTIKRKKKTTTKTMSRTSNGMKSALDSAETLARPTNQTTIMTRLAIISFVLIISQLAAIAPSSLLVQATDTTTATIRSGVNKQTTTASPDTELPPVTSIAYDKIGEGGPAVMLTEEEDSTSSPTTTAITTDTDPQDSSDGVPAVESRSLGRAGETVNSLHNNKDKDGDTSHSGRHRDHSAKLSIDSSDKSDQELSSGSTDDESTELDGGTVIKNYRKSGAPSHLNMTQIDDIYVKGRRDEQATVEAWQAISRKLKKGISGIIGSIVPLALNMSQEARISSNCSGAMLKWVLSMNQLKAWALRMLDASGKPIAGLLEGSMTMFGNYRQCLKIRAPDDDEIEFAGEFREYFRGKYCIIQAKPWLPEKSRFYNLNTKLSSLMDSCEDNESYDRTIFEELNEWLLAFNFVNIRFDLCVPSLCSREDIQKTINHLLKGIDLKARVSRCEMDMPSGASKYGLASSLIESGSAEPAEALLLASALDGQSSNRSLTTTTDLLDLSTFSQLGWVILPLVALALVSLATLLSLTLGDDEDDDGIGSGAGCGDVKPNRLKHTIKSLSLKRSIESHLSVDLDQLADDKPLALYGVRFLLVLWVILVESAVNLKFEYLRELMMLKELIFWWPMQFIINSTMQYDSLILLTAFTMGYKNCLNDRVNNAKSLTRFVVDKYVRLMPSVMLMVALVILLPLVYRGPVWNDYVAKQSAVCQSTGWLNSIFLQNYLPYEQICLPQTWLLCVEFQLVLIMAPLVYYLNKSYTSNFGCNSKSIIIGGGISGNGNIIVRQQGHSHHKSTSPSSAAAATAAAAAAAAASTSRKDDASKSFHWLWTVPGAVLAACIVLGLASSFYNVYYNELPPSWFYTMADPDSKALYFGAHMTKLWTHLAVFAMGILAGVECRRATKNVHRGYRSSNINFMSHTNTLSNYHKSKSTSATSLPIMLARQNGDTNSSSRGGSDQWNANLGAGCGMSNAGSSVSININGNNQYNQRHDQQQQQLQQQQRQQHHYGSGDNNSSNMCGANPHDDGIGTVGGCSSSGGGGGGICSLLLDALGFITAITIMSAIIFSTHDWALNDLPKPFIAGLFDAGSRFLWSLAMIWILFRLSVPYKDRSFCLLAKSLGHPFMQSKSSQSTLAG